MTNVIEFEQAGLRTAAMHALIPGLSFMLNGVLDSMNQLRKELGLEPYRLETSVKRGRPPASKSEMPPSALADSLPTRRAKVRKTRRKAAKSVSSLSSERIGAQGRKRIANSTREDWRLVKAAGISNGKRPSRALVAEAKKLLGKKKA